jgi:5'-nucleotidase
MNLRRPLSLALPFTLSLLAVAAGGGAGCGSGGSGGSGGTGGGAPKQDRNVVVLFTSDEHSHLFAFAPEVDDYPLATTAGSGALVGGVARRAAILASERKAANDAGKDSITVSAGDNQMGGLAHVAFESDSIDYGTMKALGYDVTTLGNHEFDFGPKSLAKSINAAKAGAGLPAIVASNIHFSSTSPDDDDLAALYSDKAGDSAAIHPYQVVTTKGGVKIGVLGYVGVNAEHVAPNKKPVKFSSNAIAPALEGKPEDVLPELYKDLQPVVDTLRNTEKVDLVIALSHAGIMDSSSDMAIAQGEDYLVAQNVSGIDLIVSGHAHNPDPKPIKATNTKTGKDTLILNGSAYGRHVGRVELMVHADGSPPMWIDSSQALISVDDKTVPDPTQAKAADGLLSTIEAASFATSGSWLEGLLSRVTSTTVKDDKSKPGDLYWVQVPPCMHDRAANIGVWRS